MRSKELLEHFQTAVAVVQNALFPEGIMYRKDIGFFAPPDNEVSAIVFRTLISIASEPNWEEIKSGRGEWI